MISIQKKFLFIHVHKTGGHSLQNVLKDFSEDKIECTSDIHDGIERYAVRSEKYTSRKHMSLSDYKKVVEPEVFNALYKFATIRNPWDKMISFYFSPHRRIEKWDREDFVKLIREVPSLRSFIGLESNGQKVLRRLGWTLRNEPLDRHVDFIMKFENLENDFKLVCNELKIPTVDLQKRNASKHHHYSTYYDEELIKIVGKRFEDEIEYGEYRFERK